MILVLPPTDTNGAPGFVANWPADTELLFPKKPGKLMLTFQHKLVSVVVQDSFANARAALVFKHTFPNLLLSQTFI